MSCFPLVRGRVMRVTRLDGCGEVILGPDSTVASDGFISIALSPQQQEGQAIAIQNAAGRLCVSDTPPPQFTGYGIEVSFCGVDPELFTLMSGQPVVMNADGDEAVGFRVNSGIDVSSSGFALEVWSNVPAAVCEPGTGTQYGYFLIPFAKGGILGDFTIANDAVNFTLTGAQSKDGSAWGVGPYDVTRDDASLPGPLNEAIDPKDHLHLELVSVAPPTATCGATAVGVAATGATAGTPGTTTPANSYAPLNLAGLTGVTASPNTAWTTGQHIVLRDGSTANWNGSAWEAGPA